MKKDLRLAIIVLEKELIRIQNKLLIRPVLNKTDTEIQIKNELESSEIDPIFYAIRILKFHQDF